MGLAAGGLGRPLRPTPSVSAVIMSTDRDDKAHTGKLLCDGKGTQFYHGIVAPSETGHRSPTPALPYKRRRSTTKMRGWAG